MHYFDNDLFLLSSQQTCSFMLGLITFFTASDLADLRMKVIFFEQALKILAEAQYLFPRSGEAAGLLKVPPISLKTYLKQRFFHAEIHCSNTSLQLIVSGSHISPLGHECQLLFQKISASPLPTEENLMRDSELSYHNIQFWEDAQVFSASIHFFDLILNPANARVRPDFVDQTLQQYIDQYFPILAQACFEYRIISPHILSVGLMWIGLFQVILRYLCELIHNDAMAHFSKSEIFIITSFNFLNLRKMIRILGAFVKDEQQRIHWSQYILDEVLIHQIKQQLKNSKLDKNDANKRLY